MVGREIVKYFIPLPFFSKDCPSVFPENATVAIVKSGHLSQHDYENTTLNSPRRIIVSRLPFQDQVYTMLIPSNHFHN